jgi:hypothetical protein
MTKGGESNSRALMTPFLAIHAKGGEKVLAQSKRTAPPPKFSHHHLNFKKEFLNWYDSQLINFKLISYCVQKGEKSSISKLIYQNPLEH